MWRARWCGLTLAAAATVWAIMTAGQGLAAQDSATFAFRDQPGQYLDVLMDGKTVGRYMYAYDPSSVRTSLASTNKTYLHVFDALGKRPITNGPVGEYAHHRGIMIGWQKASCNGKVYNYWAMTDNAQIHRTFSVQEADASHATFTSLVDWMDEKDKPLIKEERTMTFRRAESPAYLLIDFTSKLTATAADITLGGNAEHAGIQFRPAEGIELTKTMYVYPGENTDPHQIFDLAWIGETFSLDGKVYSIVDMNHPGNPQGSKISAYRNYGRFGYAPTATLQSGNTLTVRYRFLVAEGEMPAAGTIQQVCNAFTGRSDPVPSVTVRPAEQPVPPKAKNEGNPQAAK